MEYNMTTTNQVGKYEVLDDNDENINKNLYELDQKEDEIDDSKFEEVINRFTNNINEATEFDYEELVKFLRRDVDGFGLTDEGKELLLTKLDTCEQNEIKTDYILNSRKRVKRKGKMLNTPILAHFQKIPVRIAELALALWISR